jgi:hypothetical protein
VVEQFKELIKRLQAKGLPIIILRDNLTGKPSITYSFFVISGSLVILGLIGKFAKVSGGIDMDNALNFFYGCGAMYIGRKITNKSSK